MKKITYLLAVIGFVVTTNVGASCVSVGDVKEVFGNGAYTTLYTSDGTFTFSGPLAVRNTFNSEHRHAPACYNSHNNTLTYTLPGGGQATKEVK